MLQGSRGQGPRSCGVHGPVVLHPEDLPQAWVPGTLQVVFTLQLYGLVFMNLHIYIYALTSFKSIVLEHR